MSGVDPLLGSTPEPGWRERLAALRAFDWSPGRVAAALLFIAALLFASWAALRTPPGPAPELSLPRASARPVRAIGSDRSTSDKEETTTPSTIVVHAAGAVNAPGLYRLPLGSRIADLLTAAGGPGAGADVDRVNLAAPLADGARFYLPRAGQEPPPELAATGSGTAAGSEGASGGASGRSGPVNLNTASADELDGLPGVGPATAQAILRYRDENGRFGSVDELLEVRGIGPAKLDQLRSLVTV